MIAMGNAILLGPLTVLFPYLAENAARDQIRELRMRLLRGVRILLFFFSLICIIVSIIRVPLIKVLFERGAFNRFATISVSGIIPGFSIGVAAMVTVILLFRAFYAMGDMKSAAIISCSGAISYFLLSGFLSKILELQGIVIAYCIAWVLMLNWALVRLWRGNIRELWSSENGLFFLKLLLALGTAAFVTLICSILIIRPAMEGPLFHLGVRLIVSAMAGCVAFFAVTVGLFHMEEVTIFLKLIPGRIRIG
jgi:putative peptidoglycan lipid II flippase